MTMHVPKGKPACWTTDATPRASWAWDQGRACGNGGREMKRTLVHTPGCHGCARADRAAWVEAGRE